MIHATRSLLDNFSGVLRVTSTGEVAIVGLRLRVNGNNELKMTTTSPSNEVDPSTSEDRFFAHLADSGGWPAVPLNNMNCVDQRQAQVSTRSFGQHVADIPGAVSPCCRHSLLLNLPLPCTG